MTIDVMTKPRQLESYVAGGWVRGAGKGATLLNAATGAPVARIDSSGVDFAAALAYGRETVGPKLRKLSFHERAAMLKALGQKLMALKEEFYALSLATGATRTDGWIDIEGGIGTLLSYASKARRELPNSRVLTDGDVEPLSKDSSFSAQHILTPLEGVAIHINAFNFPVWGMLEKVAPTLIAGVPTIVKPASQTAYLTELHGAPDRRERHPARGCHPAHRGLGGRSARPRHRPGRRDLHRLRLDRAQAAQPSGGG